MVRKQKHSSSKKTINTRATPLQSSLFNDFKNASLLVSLTINVAIFIGWLALQITTQYDEQVASLLFQR